MAASASGSKPDSKGKAPQSRRTQPAIGGRPRLSNRERRTNWEGSPCPACCSALRYGRDLTTPSRVGGGEVRVLLRCENGHHWEERLDLATFHSGVFVERRCDLE